MSDIRKNSFSPPFFYVISLCGFLEILQNCRFFRASFDFFLLKNVISGVELHLPTEEMSHNNRGKINISRRKTLDSRDFDVKIFKGQSKATSKTAYALQL
jgi:hypothetical protein